MSLGLKTWWRNKSGQSKTITVLATLLLLDIGLCFSTPAAFNAVNSRYRGLGVNSFIGLMVGQTLFCVALGVSIALVAIFWHPGLSRPHRRKDHDD